MRENVYENVIDGHRCLDDCIIYDSVLDRTKVCEKNIATRTQFHHLAVRCTSTRDDRVHRCGLNR